MVVTTVSSKSDENRVIPELLISPNAHNQRKYWIAIKANLFRDRAYSPSFSPPKATSIQWGLSTNDPGMGGGVFYYPVTFNPFIALAGAIALGVNNYANDAVVKNLGTTSCTIDSTPAAYTGAYRVVVIGRN